MRQGPPPPRPSDLPPLSGDGGRLSGGGGGRIERPLPRWPPPPRTSLCWAPCFKCSPSGHMIRPKTGIDYHVSVPGVISDSELAQRVNQEIQERVGRPSPLRAQQDWEDYREVFFATGGTQQQWDEREMDVIVDYEIKSQSEKRPSPLPWISAKGGSPPPRSGTAITWICPEDRDITLQDLLGDAWVERCNQAVQSYIAAHTDEHGYTPLR